MVNLYTDIAPISWIVGPHTDVASWFRASRSELEKQTGLTGPTASTVPEMVSEFESNPAYLEDLSEHEIGDPLGALLLWRST
jgi:hypothetical protein